MLPSAPVTAHSQFRRTLAAATALVATIAAAAAFAFPTPASAQVPIPQLSAGAANTCAVFTNAKVYCWGSNMHKQLGIGENDLSYALNAIPVNAINGVPKVVSTGYDSACTIVHYGSIRCWGNNLKGALGKSNVGRNVPNKQVSGQITGGAWASPASVAMGQRSMCYLDLDHLVKCQGLNSSGQLGNGSYTDSLVPVAVQGFGHYPLQVVSGSNHACALLDNGNVRCWGDNSRRQLGMPESTTPKSNVSIPVTDLPNDVIQIASGYDHSCAIRQTDKPDTPANDKDISVVCWGANSYGQLGDGTVTPTKGTENAKSLGGDAKQVVTGQAHTCVLLKNGSVRCWGANSYGQLGNGTDDGSTKPVSVVGLPRPAAEISAGAFHTCAKLTDGTLFCWGRNDKGQLGNGTRDRSTKPVSLARFAGPSYTKVKLERRNGHSNFVGLYMIVPPVPGDIGDRCKGSTISTVRITQAGKVTRKGIRAKLRVSQTKCVATLRVNDITNSVAPAEVYIRSSFRGNSRLPAAKFSQTFPSL